MWTMSNAQALVVVAVVVVVVALLADRKRCLCAQLLIFAGTYVLAARNSA